MRTLLLLILMSAWPCLAQDVPPGLQQTPADPQQQAPSAQPDAPKPDPTIVVPAGTRLELALANPLHRRDARVGDTVRAVTSFPVTVGQDLAIPQGSFLDGRIVKIGKHGSTRFDGLQIEFKQLILSNGYNVTLDGSVIDARALAPVSDSRLPVDPRQAEAAASSEFVAKSFQQPPPQPPPLPPLPQVGPPKGPIIAAAVGGMVAFVVVGILMGHRHSPYFNQGRDFDTGFQFEIVLQTPLTLDRASVAAAVSGSTDN